MKYILSALLVLFLFSVKAKDEKIVKSTIKEVTVYAQGAQINRKANYSITKGINKIVIEGISPYIDPKSLQVNATGDVILLDSKYAVHYPSPEINVTSNNEIPAHIRNKITLLEDSLFEQAYILMAIQDEIDVLNNSKKILKNNGSMKGEGKVNDSIPLLKEAMHFYEEKMKSLNKELLVLGRKKTLENRKKSKMDSRLSALKRWKANNNMTNPKPQGPSYRITITLSAKTNASGRIYFNYLVKNAGWEAMYDLRSSVSSGKINLNYKANIYQNTGVEWKNVKLNISTNNPYQNKTKPTLHPWIVEYGVAYQKNKYRKDARNKAYGNNAPQTQTLSYEDGEVEEVNFDYAQTSANYTTVIDQIISAEFKIDLPYTIASNNEKHLVLIKNEDIDADFLYYTVPKIDPSVYLVANISNLNDLQLVPAKANIFFEGSYVGETFLNPGVMDDTLSLSLGKDPNILVKRSFVKKASKEKIIGTDISKTSNYQIEVKNNKNKNIRLIVQDQIPVTKDAKIKIEINEISKGKINKLSGLVEWEFKLKSKESKTLPFSYTVVHDKSRNIAIR